MAKKKTPTDQKEITKRVAELKIELLKQPQKKKSIKKEIARLLTEHTKQMHASKKAQSKPQTKAGGNA